MNEGAFKLLGASRINRPFILKKSDDKTFSTIYKRPFNVIFSNCFRRVPSSHSAPLFFPLSFEEVAKKLKRVWYLSSKFWFKIEHLHRTTFNRKIKMWKMIILMLGVFNFTEFGIPKFCSTYNINCKIAWKFWTICTKQWYIKPQNIQNSSRIFLQYLEKVYFHLLL